MRGPGGRGGGNSGVPDWVFIMKEGRGRGLGGLCLGLSLLWRKLWGEGGNDVLENKAFINILYQSIMVIDGKN